MRWEEDGRGWGGVRGGRRRDEGGGGAKMSEGWGGEWMRGGEKGVGGGRRGWWRVA